MGYILFHSVYGEKNAPKKHKSYKPYEGCSIPIHGDAWFMPDWTRIEGRQIISDRENQYEALMNIFNMNDIYEYAMEYISNESNN